MIYLLFIIGLVLFEIYIVNCNKNVVENIMCIYKKITVNIPIMNLKRELKNDPDNKIILRNIARLYNETGSPDKALPYAQNAYFKDVNDLATIKLLSNIFIKLNRKEDALKKLDELDKKIKKSNQTNSIKAMYYYEAARLYYDLAFKEKALEMINKTLKLQKDNQIEIEKGRFEKSDAIFSKYLKFKNEIINEREKNE